MASSVNKQPVTIYTHEGTGLKYVRGHEKVLFETGIVMERSEFENLKDNGLAAKLLELSADEKNTNYDFSFACSIGRLRKKRGYGTRQENVPTKNEAKISSVWLEEHIKQEEPIEQKKEEPAQNKRVFSSVLLVMAVMVTVGLGSAVMSAYHTSMFLYMGGKPAWTAIMTGTMFIMFSGTAFTAARYFLQRKNAQSLFGVLFLLFGIAVICYSVFSTLTLNFEQFKWVDDEKTAIAIEDSEALIAHERLITEAREALEEANIQVEHLEGEAEYWRSMSWRRYDEFQEQLLSAQTTRTFLRERIRELEASRPAIVALAGEERETVYTFLARLAGLREDVARFFVYVAPACLYDILAPFALSVVLLLLDRKKYGIKDS